MKLSYEDKQKIYELRKNGVAYSRLTQAYDVQISNLRYMVKLMDRYSVEVGKKSLDQELTMFGFKKTKSDR